MQKLTSGRTSARLTAVTGALPDRTAAHRLALALVVALLVSALVGIPPLAAQPPSGASIGGPEDTLSVIPANQALSNREVALELSQATPWVLPISRVLIARDDGFADSLASGVLQADAPLLLVPSTGPVPTAVMDEVRRLGASEAVILGGSAAVGDEAVATLTNAGLTVSRLAGASRIETAVAIAQAAPPADTVLLARAGASAGAAPSQGFADALGAGAVAAANRWPVLLTETDRLSDATAAFLSASGVRRVLVLGGTAAVSDAVATAVRDLGITTDRIAGPDRFGTAVELAKTQGAETAQQVDHVTIVEGQGDDAWAGGFAAAARSAQLGAPVLLATEGTVPQSTQEFLANGIGGSSFAQTGVEEGEDEVVITCVIGYQTCEEIRRLSGLPEAPIFTFSPVPGAPVTGGQQITVSVDPVALAANGTLFYDSECFGTQQTVQLDEQAQATLTVPVGLESGCDVIVSTTLLNGQFGGVYAFWPASDGTENPTDTIQLSYWIFNADGPLTQPLALDVETTCEDDPAGTPPRTGRVHHAQFASQDGGGVSARSVVPRGACTVQAHLPPETIGATWQVTSTFAGGQVYLSGSGSVAQIDLSTIPAELPQVQLAFRVELSGDAPTAARPLPAGGTVLVRALREGLTVTCDDGTATPADVTQTHRLEVPDGTTCTVTADAGTAVVSQVDHPFTFAPEATFTADATLGDVLLFRI